MWCNGDMQKGNKKMLIIDGNALVHRSFHALPPNMVLRDGRPVNAVYGFASVLIKALREFKPEYIVVTFDRKGPTFRHEKYKEYKAHREKAPDELYAQIPMVKDLVTAFNIPIFEKDGFEADDLIGTITRKLDGEVEKIIVTGDMDTLQLVNEHTKVYTMSRGMSDSILYGKEEVQAKYDLAPEQIIDYKALRGDPSDNIPGVKGIGEKTATELLNNFSSLEFLYDNLDSDKIKERIRDLLLKYKDDAIMSKDLATINCNVDIDFDLSNAITRELDKKKLIEVFENFEFRSLLPRLKSLFEELAIAPTKDGSGANEDKFIRNEKLFHYHYVDNDKDFEIFKKKLSLSKRFTFDTETSGIDPINSYLLGISFSWEEGEAYYLDFAALKSDNDKFNGNGNNLFDYDRAINKKDSIINANWFQELSGIFSDIKIKKNAHNSKFDIRVLKKIGIEVKGLEFDTMLASYLLDPGQRQHSLDAVTMSEYGFEKINKEELLGKGKDKKGFSDIDKRKLFLYSCEDADFANRLKNSLEVRLKEKNLYHVFQEIDLPLVPVLAYMEENGIELSKDFLNKMQDEISRDIVSLEKKIWQISGVAFNIKSTQQLAEVLFTKLDISVEGIKKNKKGFSTAFLELEKIKDSHELIPLIQEYRELTKLQSTYIEALPKLINPITGRIHTSFNQTIAATGRLSSTDPNLQNIPVRTELGKRIRQAFVASEGYILMAFDYSQIELRLAAHMSGDEKMIEAFKKGVDIHSVTASLINGVELEAVTEKMRREAKAVNFGIIYGQGPHGLSQGADIPFNQAKEFIDNYFKVYKGVKEYVEKTIEEARVKGYVETLHGRKRWLADINSKMPMLRKAAERMAANTPLQGTAADIIKLAMIKIFSECLDDNTRMLLQVHDELVFEVKEGEEKKTFAKIKKIMENIVELKVPLCVDVKLGKNWGIMEKSEL